MVKKEIEEIIGVDATNAIPVSAKSGMGVDALLEQLVELIPAPEGDPDGALQALIIDSWFDNYLGVVSLVRVKNGVLNKGEKIIMKTQGKSHIVDSVGIFTPKRQETGSLAAGSA